MTGDIILYSTGCPKCKVLKIKLAKKGIQYSERSDLEEMQALGMKSAPALMVNNSLLDFNHAIAWLNEQREEDA